MYTQNISEEQWLELEREWKRNLINTTLDIGILKGTGIVEPKIREFDEEIAKSKDHIETLIRQISKLTSDEQILCNSILKNTLIKDLVELESQRARFLRHKRLLSAQNSKKNSHLDVESAASHQILSIAERDTLLRRSGKTFTGRCPLHDDRSPSFYIYPETNSFYCFGCNQGGNTIDYVMQKDGLDFKRAVQFINNL